MDESERQPPEEQKGPAREDVLRLVVEPEPPHAGKPLTREDVLRLLAERGRPEGLDLRQADLRQADLTKVRLQGSNLSLANLQDANLMGANLRRVSLFRANLEEAFLLGANLQRASLAGANLRRAYLVAANLDGAHLEGADLRRATLALASVRDANLEDTNWGNYLLGDEIDGPLGDAASAYRALKQRHTELVMYDVAGEFHYREMEARRKLAWKGDPLQEQKRRVPYALVLNVLRFLYGYGERPERVIGWAVAVVFGLAILVHWPLGTVEGGFWDALYYSAVSFTALGYGASASDPQGWAGRFLGAGESFLGVFMMALFLVTFTRKMTR